MKGLHEFPTVFLHRSPVDGRKMINGLTTLVETAMGQSPLSNAIFAFVNKRRETVKLVYWDRSGFALWMKRLEREKFRWPIDCEGECVALTSQQLEWLLDGYDIARMKPHASLSFSSFL